MFRKTLVILLIFVLPAKTLATKVIGRATIGGYVASERFSDNTGGSDKNDFMVASSRFYMKATEIGDQKYESVLDLRDKHDFFDKLNKEQLTLDAANSFQIRQASFFVPKLTSYLSANFGRFMIPNAGAVNLDGAQVEYNWDKNTSAGLFAGKNAKRVDQTYSQYNPNSNQYGITSIYQTREAGWDKNFYMAHAYVNQLEGSELDRSYFFHNLVYQWEESSRLISLMYLDFTPRTNVQTGNFLWQQAIGKNYLSQLGLLGIDVIEYTRRQGVRERLTPSPYKEASYKFDWLKNNLEKWQFGTSYGQRQADNYTKNEFYIGYEKNEFMNRNIDCFTKIGVRKNFTSNDQFVHAFLGYFSRKWEGGLDLDYSIENYTDTTTKHGLSTELSLSNYYSREMYWTVSWQRAADEGVTIYTGFFKLGYRFGNQELPPLRDGAPPRGQL